MQKLRQRVATKIARKALNYVRKDPDDHMMKLVNWAEKHDKTGYYKGAYGTLRGIVGDRSNNWNRMIRSVLDDIEPIFPEKFMTNMVLNASFRWNATKRKLEKTEDCNIPWAVLMDPTASCNLRCVGCWAAEYAKTASMDYGLLDRIIREGKQLGIHMYIYSGGEPMMRKADLIRLAERHNDCYFMFFTNATLIDEDFVRDMCRVGNIMPAISVEGFEKETDLRRGNGTYGKVIQAMDLLKAHGAPFGFSTCYHRLNTDVVGSEEYIDLMVDKGCRFGWYFTYMPLGADAKLDLLATPEQREYMYHQVRKFRETKPIFTMDFWNDGEFVGGCIAGGRNYLHINAAGDVEPCAFIHYSNANIHDVSLLEALKSPLFREYRAGQPFNGNMLRPCPLLDNPEKLRGMVERSGARSTQLLDKEDIHVLTAKCESVSKAWATRADALWRKSAGPD